VGPIFRVSLRALLGGRRGWLVAASDLLFVLLALIPGGRRQAIEQRRLHVVAVP